MFTALVLVCSLDIARPDTCYTSVSTQLFEEESDCVRDVIMTFDSGRWHNKLKNGEIYDMVAYQCVEWSAGNNI
jgi:hypothetical protein